MCYSAQVWANYRKYVREFGATISVEEFAILYFHDKGKARPRRRRGWTTPSPPARRRRSARSGAT